MKKTALVIVLIFFCNCLYAEDVDKKKIFLSMYRSLSVTTQIINTRYKNVETLNGIGIDLGCDPTVWKDSKISWCRFSANGELYGLNAQYGVLVYFVPVVQFNSVTWKCFGYPAEALAPGCELENTVMKDVKKY